MRFRRSREKGQSTLEYAAILLIIALIMLALLLMATPMGRRITCEVQSSFSKILGGKGGACSAADTKAEEDKHKPKEACVKNETSREKKVSGTFFITVEGGGRIKVEEMSDGTYRVTETGILRGSYSFSGPELSASVTGNDVTSSGDYGKKDASKSGAQASGSVEVGASAEGSRVFNVGNAEEKDKLVNYLQNQVDTATLGTAAPGLGLAKWGYDYVTDNKGTRTYEPPSPEEYTVQAGEDGKIEGSLDMGPVSVGGAGKVSTALGATFHKDGSATYYYSNAAEVNAEGKTKLVGNISGPSAKGAVKGENVMAVTVDKNGQPTKMNVTTMFDAKASTSGGAVKEAYKVFTGEDADPLKTSKEHGRVYNSEIDMTNPESAQIGYDYMKEAGIPIYGAAKMATGDSAIPKFHEEARKNGISTVREMTTDDQTNLAAGWKAKGDGFNFGSAYSDTTSSATYKNGKYWNGKEWVKWDGC